MSRFFAFAALPIALIACTGGDGSDGESSSQDVVVNQSSSDLSVLKTEFTGKRINVSNGRAVVDGPVAGDKAFDVSQCTALPASLPIPPREQPAANLIHCTKAFEVAFGVPALHEIVLSKTAEVCEVLIVEAVSKKAAVEKSDGVGAYYSTGRHDFDGFVPKAKLSKVRDAQLKDGTAAVVFKFGALARCDMGGRLGEAEFKPFIRFTKGANQYKNWDDSAPPSIRRPGGTNYLIGWNTRFDRTSELLK